MATIKDVAKLAGVSLSTASYALNGHNKITEATKERVIDAAKQLNYQKNGLATDLKRNRTQTIALILSDLSGPFYMELIRGVQEVSLENGYDLIACSSVGGTNSTAIKFLKEKRVDGAIVLAHNINDEIILESAREGFPIIVLDRLLKGDYIYNVLVDNVQGGFMATDFLIKCGCKKIAYISGPPNSRDNKLRLQGYLQALKQYGIEYQSKLNISGRFTSDGGYTATKLLIAQRDLPDGIFYANDEMAVGGMKALKEANIKVPENISIVGFDDILLAEYLNPSLTTVRQPKYEAGALAAHIIFQVLDGQKIDHDYKLQTELIVRHSCMIQ